LRGHAASYLEGGRDELSNEDLKARGVLVLSSGRGSVVLLFKRARRQRRARASPSARQRARPARVHRW